jgi:4-hydroxy-tetrahydrodipicolinate reductase
MKLALIGDGSMGRLVAHLITNQGTGDEIGVTITSRDAAKSASELATSLHSHDVAIDFSVASAVLRNIEACAIAEVPLVEGTTGWKDEESKARRVVADHNAALVYGANFSVGVNIFYRVVSHAADLMSAIEGYQAFIEEEHHSRKRDAPSGTAIKLRELMAKSLDGDIPIASTRAGHIPGTHRVGFDSAADQLMFTHMARSREGFAAGALMAARWIKGCKGFYEFSDVIDKILKK